MPWQLVAGKARAMAPGTGRQVIVQLGDRQACGPAGGSPGGWAGGQEGQRLPMPETGATVLGGHGEHAVVDDE